MRILDRRKYPRSRQKFPVRIFKEDLDYFLEGVIVNLSQQGAFIKTQHCRYLQVKDEAMLTCLLPPDFTGHDATIGLQGPAIVRRIDQQSEGVAVEFVKMFRQFKRISFS
jgi:hypothetical protein